MILVYVFSASCRNSIISINGQLTLWKGQQCNCKSLNYKIDSVAANCTRLSQQVETNTGDIATANGRLDGLDGSIADLTSRIQKLEAINKIWQKVILRWLTKHLQS